MPRRNFFTEVINRQADTALRGRQAEELAISNQTLAQRQIIEALYKQALAEAQQAQNALGAAPIGPGGMRNDLWTAIQDARKRSQEYDLKATERGFKLHLEEQKAEERRKLEEYKAGERRGLEEFKADENRELEAFKAKQRAETQEKIEGIRTTNAAVRAREIAEIRNKAAIELQSKKEQLLRSRRAQESRQFAQRKQQLYSSVKPRLPKGSVIDPTFFADSAEGLKNMRDAIEADLDPGYEVHNTGDGGLYVLDKKTKDVVRVLKTAPDPTPVTTDISEQPAPEETLFDLAPYATGITSAFYETVSKLPGRQSLNTEEELAVNAREQFNLFQNEVARSLVLNERFPVAERQAVLKAISLEPKVFDSVPAMTKRLESAKDFLSTKLEQAARDANDKSLPDDVREGQRANAAALKNALARIGEPSKDGSAPPDIDALLKKYGQ